MTVEISKELVKRSGGAFWDWGSAVVRRSHSNLTPKAQENALRNAAEFTGIVGDRLATIIDGGPPGVEAAISHTLDDPDGAATVQ